MASYRTEKDSMGEIKVPADKYYGAQTARSVMNFRIGAGHEEMPAEIIKALAVIKKSAARANLKAPLPLEKEKADIICAVCDEIISGKMDGNFPLVVFQTGSGTQSNMNVNEVIAIRGNETAGRKLLHPNDDVNKSQSSNDVFPSALHVSAALSLTDLIKEIRLLSGSFEKLEKENEGIIKAGRTHLQDAVPIRFSDEVSGWRVTLEKDLVYINNAAESLMYLPLGGTAVGTGLNSFSGFDKLALSYINEETGIEKHGFSFKCAENKFSSMTSKSELANVSSSLKILACDLIKIASDIRLLASGPRLGLGEITIPSNEPGSSIMPGKVNPTQCEQVIMVADQVIGNDLTVSLAAGQGILELNMCMPVIGYNVLQSVRLLTASLSSFRINCVDGIKANKEKMKSNLDNSVMLVTALSPVIGYEKAAEIAKKALSENLTVKEACLKLGYMSSADFDKYYHPEKMC